MCKPLSIRYETRTHTHMGKKKVHVWTAMPYAMCYQSYASTYSKPTSCCCCWNSCCWCRCCHRRCCCLCRCQYVVVFFDIFFDASFICTAFCVFLDRFSYIEKCEANGLLTCPLAGLLDRTKAPLILNQMNDHHMLTETFACATVCVATLYLLCCRCCCTCIEAIVYTQIYIVPSVRLSCIEIHRT